MSVKTRSPRLDLAICGSLIALSLLILWGTKSIPPPFFDPLGSAAFPKYAAWLILLLSLGVAFRAAASLKTRKPQPRSNYKKEPLLALASVAIPALYLLSMQLGLLGFRWATIAFIFLLSSLLSRFDKRVMLVSAIIALLFGFGGQYLFTEFFYMDLPQ